ncbi:hypothetical protein ACH3O9_11270 [Leeuwenhoekiella sp. A16]|uniref:hypothetical protein n=1 Tax=Leeuwenhoekiella sp. A16 TaxID=3141462 RepID=UPI003A808F05
MKKYFSLLFLLVAIACTAQNGNVETGNVKLTDSLPVGSNTDELVVIRPDFTFGRVPRPQIANEADPTVSDLVKNITQTDIDNWNAPSGVVEDFVRNYADSVGLSAKEYAQSLSYQSGATPLTTVINSNATDTTAATPLAVYNYSNNNFLKLSGGGQVNGNIVVGSIFNNQILIQPSGLLFDRTDALVVPANNNESDLFIGQSAKKFKSIQLNSVAAPKINGNEIAVYDATKQQAELMVDDNTRLPLSHYETPAGAQDKVDALESQIAADYTPNGGNTTDTAASLRAAINDIDFSGGGITETRVKEIADSTSIADRLYTDSEISSLDFETQTGAQNKADAAKALAFQNDTIILNESRAYAESLIGLDAGANIEAFGATGDDTSNDQVAWNAAVEAAKVGNRTVIIPPRKYILDSVVIYSDVNYIGLSEHESILQAADTDLDGFVKLDAGPVQRLQITSLTIQGIGATNPNQKGIDFSAKELPEAPYHGGLWYTTLTHITVKGFDGDPMYLQAQQGPNGGDLVNQFLTFNHCRFFRSENNASTVRITGKVGQVDFNNCIAEGQVSSWNADTETTSRNIYIGREFIGGSPINDTTPYSIYFNLVTLQNADLGIEIDRAQDIHISGYFENLHKGIKIVNSASNVTVDKSRFANAASNGSGTGYGVYVNASSASITNNKFIGTHDYIIWGDSHVGITQYNNTGSGTLTTQGITRQLAVAGDGSLDIVSLNSFLVNTGTTALSTITSKHITGDEITITALGAGTLTINNAGNIDIPGGSLVLSPNETATFRKYDFNSDWLLINTTH